LGTSFFAREYFRNLTPGQEVVIRTRLVLKPFVSNEDVIEEYERWNEELGKK
jgi:hypothetical protein